MTEQEAPTRQYERAVPVHPPDLELGFIAQEHDLRTRLLIGSTDQLVPEEDGAVRRHHEAEHASPVGEPPQVGDRLAFGERGPELVLEDHYRHAVGVLGLEVGSGRIAAHHLGAEGGDGPESTGAPLLGEALHGAARRVRPGEDVCQGLGGDVLGALCEAQGQLTQQ